MMPVPSVSPNLRSRWPAHARTRPSRQRGRAAAWRVIAVAGALGGLLASCTSGPDVPGTATPGTQITASVDQSPSAGTSPATDAAPSTSTYIPTPGATVPSSTSTESGSSGIRIGLVAATGSDPFGKAVTDSISTQALAAGAVLIRCDPGGDQMLSLDCARRMATQHVDGWIALQPRDPMQALCDAGPQDVPLIAIDAASVSCQTANIGADDRQAGFLVGAALGATHGMSSRCVDNTVVIITNGDAGVVSTRRVDGIKAGFESACPGSTTGALLLDAGTQDRAYDGFTRILTSLPDGANVLVAAVNDGAALGVAAAIDKARAGHLALASIGADQRARCQMLASPEWIGDAALFPDRYGEAVVPAVLDAIEGRSIPSTIYIPAAFLTATTLGSFYDIADCPVQ